MEEFWRKTSELLWARPLLWVPVLGADLLAFLASLGSHALMRTVVLNRLQYHSVLGGAAVRGQLTPAAVQHAGLLAALVTLPFDYLRLLLYAVAFIVTAALVLAFVRREEKPLRLIPSALRRHAVSAFSLSLRALAIYGGMALLLGWTTQALIAHGHKAWLTGGWLELGTGAIRVVLLALLLAPVAVQAIAGRRPAGAQRQAVQVFALALGLVSLLLGSFVTANIRSVRITSLPVRYLLELTGSWIVALPYVVFFVAATFVALKTMAEAEPNLGSERAL